MKCLRRATIVCGLPIWILVASPGPAQQSGPAAAAAGFTDAQLEQMAAPIALYPDGLLMQILMGATYPLEIVEAQRWTSSRSGLTGKALEEALKKEDWDASVKSLCTFPGVLKRMSENLDWTRDLGDAFLGQQAALLDAVQRLRQKAYEAGNLKTTQEQTVIVQADRIIVIQPATPEVIYVPTYSPTVVYGYWPYPTTVYAPLYAPGHGALAFATGIAVGAAIWGDCHWGWGHSECHIDIDHYHRFERNTNINVNRNTNINASGTAWRHDPAHRSGVNYRDDRMARTHGRGGAPDRVSQDQARGRAGAQGAQGASAGRSGGAGTGAGAGGTARPGASGARGSGSGAGASSQGGAFSGAGNADLDKAASSRGAASRGTTSRGGGGGRSGGGGGGRGSGGGRR